VIKLKKLTIEVIIIHPFFSTSFALRKTPRTGKRIYLFWETEWPIALKITYNKPFFYHHHTTFSDQSKKKPGIIFVLNDSTGKK